MLYIVKHTGNDIIWHTGNPHPLTSPEDIRCVTVVQADGDELDFIRTNFTNLPDMPSRVVVRWFGDHAKFIAAHLTRHA